MEFCVKCDYVDFEKFPLSNNAIICPDCIMKIKYKEIVSHKIDRYLDEAGLGGIKLLRNVTYKEKAMALIVFAEIHGDIALKAQAINMRDTIDW